MFRHGLGGVGLEHVLAVFDDALVAAVLCLPLRVANGQVFTTVTYAHVVCHIRRVDLSKNKSIEMKIQ